MNISTNRLAAFTPIARPISRGIVGAANHANNNGNGSKIPYKAPSVFLDEEKKKELQQDAEKLLGFLSGKRRVVALTGAGISTESGLPDYRGPDGAYSKGHKPITFQEFISSDLKRRRYWARSMRAWPYFTSVEPNRMHKAVTALERKGFVAQVLTQNVDGLHTKAGSRGVIELHGNYDVTVCLSCKRRWNRSVTQAEMEMRNPDWIVPFSQKDTAFFRPDGDVEIAGKPFAESFKDFNLPQCECDPTAILKPDVVFFGENVPPKKVEDAFRAVDDSDGLLVLGTSLQVMSAYRFALRVKERKIPMAIVNMGETRGDHIADLKLNQHTGELLDVALPLL